MRLKLAIASLALIGSVTACGSNEAPDVSSTATDAASPSATAAAKPTESATPDAPSYRILAKPTLAKALLSLEDLPPGYSQDPPSEETGNKYFCDYRPPAEERVRVERDFTKGGGMSAEFLRFSLRQFASVDDAKAAWNAMTQTLKTCKSEVYSGTKLTYSPMGAPQLGDASAGVKIDADGAIILQNFVLVGPMMISTGGGGPMNADADAIARLLQEQVNRYVVVATQQ